MNKYQIFILVFFYFPVFGSSDFDELEKDSKILESGFHFSNSSLHVVQKRWLPKSFLSEVSLGFSPVIKGFNYMNHYSGDIIYRFFINDQWSLDLQYSRYFNLRTQEGEDEVVKRGRIPLELKYSPQQSFLVGIDWYPFYGKAIFYNHLVRFDLYISLSGGILELMSISQNIPVGSLGLGCVYWWHKNFNMRWEVQGAYYKYDIVADRKKIRHVKEYLYKIYVSAGVLF